MFIHLANIRIAVVECYNIGNILQMHYLVLSLESAVR